MLEILLLVPLKKLTLLIYWNLKRKKCYKKVKIKVLKKKIFLKILFKIIKYKRKMILKRKLNLCA